MPSQVTSSSPIPRKYPPRHLADTPLVLGFTEPNPQVLGLVLKIFIDEFIRITVIVETVALVFGFSYTCNTRIFETPSVQFSNPQAADTKTTGRLVAI